MPRWSDRWSKISHYAALSREEGIGWVDIRCTLPNDSGVEDTDLCVLLGNLLENAIEGCKTVSPEMRKIKLRCSIHLGTLLIALGNTFDGDLHRDEGARCSAASAAASKKALDLLR